MINPAGTNDPDTGDIYSGLDRFGRVKDNRWIDGAGADLDRIQYGYDRASNRIWRKNVVATALGKQFDEIYSYDGVHRLKDMARGTLNGSQTALSSETFAECWTLDSTGNWKGYRQDDNGDGTWDLVQARAANPVNEIGGITNTTGPSWTQPAYNRAGNMTTMPQPADPTESYTATYDAWNRLVKIADGADTVSEYVYDGAKRRIVQKSYTGGTLDETRHLYYTEPSLWQVIEERVGASPDSADAERQFVWGKRYIDDLVVRDHDTDANGDLDERLYACQDANWNVTAIVGTSEAVQERYAYAAYGTPQFLTGTFGSRASSNFSWESLYCGYRFETESLVALYHVRNRVLNSPLGEWTQRDPWEYFDGPHLYSYIANMPFVATDPSGAFCEDKPPCTKLSQKELCDPTYLKSIPVDTSKGGGVICCNGKAYGCLWPEKGMPKNGECEGLDECGQNHEDGHAKVTKCDPTKRDPYRPLVPHEKLSPQECQLRASQVGCLCGKLRRATNDKCDTAMRKMVKILRDNVLKGADGIECPASSVKEVNKALQNCRL
ncbi:MAG: RHS repeat-associated core domain-containing protein [Planctomycetaceae bacterium]|nr:RHS repeat-associated core domain-containing protein [Planctomycetaceae bacterium]